MAYQFKREPLLDDEAARFDAAARPGLERVVCWTLRDTGVRVAELVGIRPDDLDSQRHRLTVRGKGGDAGPNSKRRIVPLTARIQALLYPWFAVHADLGIGVRQVQRLVQDVASRALIRRHVTPHVLRHTFAVTLVRKGFSLVSIMQILGHERLSSTQVYLNVSPEVMAAEFEKRWSNAP